MEYELFCVVICLSIVEVITMTVTEHKKYIEQMDAYIKKNIAREVFGLLDQGGYC
jgi:hypothetical protein